MKGWGITNTVNGDVREAGSVIAVLDALDKIDQSNTSMYWTAPPAYLGNKVGVVKLLHLLFTGLFHQHKLSVGMYIEIQMRCYKLRCHVNSYKRK